MNNFFSFLFNPLPFTVSVVQTSWCWSKSSLVVEVIDQDIGGLEFQQSGYVLHCHVSHPIELVRSYRVLSSTSIFTLDPNEFVKL